MSRKETIYTVSTETNQVLRASRDYSNALSFAATLKTGTYYMCTSVFGNLKKNDPMVDVVDLLLCR